MCKQVRLLFACGHAIDQRMSACNRRYSVPGSAGTRAACSGQSYLQIGLYETDCNICQLVPFEDQIEYHADAMSVGMVAVPSNHDSIDDWRWQQLTQLYTRLPRRLKESKSRPVAPPTTWNSRRHCTRKHSLLRTEVTPETVVGHHLWETITVTEWTPMPPLDAEAAAALDALWDETEIPELSDDGSSDGHDISELNHEEDESTEEQVFTYNNIYDEVINGEPTCDKGCESEQWTNFSAPSKELHEVKQEK